MAVTDAGYSGTPQLRKLGVRQGMRVALVDAPANWAFDGELPPVEFAGSGDADLVLAFVRAPAALTHLPEWGERIFPDGTIWVAWPRKAAGHVSDLDENLIRDSALGLGLVDVKVAALDHDWSSLKLVWRKERRRR